MEKKKHPTSLRILLGFVSTLLCLFLIISTIAAMAIADVQIITTKDNLKKIISQTLFTSAAPHRSAPKLAVGAALAPASSNSQSDTLQDTVVNAIYDLIVGQNGSSLGVSREQIGELLKKSTVSDFLSTKIAGIINDIYTGEATTTLTKSEVENLLIENAKVIEDIFHVTVNKEKIDFLATYVDSHDVIGTIYKEVNNALGLDFDTQTTDPATSPGNGNTGTTDPTPGNSNTDPSDPTSGNGSTGTTDPTPGNSNTGTSNPNSGNDSPSETVPNATVPGTVPTPANPIATMLNALRTYTSTKALVISIVVCAVLAALLFLSNWGKPFTAMVWIGSALLTASIPYLVATILASAVPSLLSNLSGWMGIAGKIAQVAMQMVLPVSLGVLVFGLVLLVCGIVFGNLVKAKALPAQNAQTAD